MGMPQVSHELLLMFTTDILEGVACLMNNGTGLHDSIKEHTLDGIGETFQTIGTSYEGYHEHHDFVNRPTHSTKSLLLQYICSLCLSLSIAKTL